MFRKLQKIIGEQMALEATVTDIAVILSKPKGWVNRFVFGITLFSWLTGADRVGLAKEVKAAALRTGKV